MRHGGGRGVGGSEDAFAKRMTDEARAIGLKKSVFKNSTGLYNPEHLMTARELAILARHIINTYPEYYPLFAHAASTSTRSTNSSIATRCSMSSTASTD